MKDSFSLFDGQKAGKNRSDDLVLIGDVCYTLEDSFGDVYTLQDYDVEIDVTRRVKKPSIKY